MVWYMPCPLCSFCRVLRSHCVDGAVRGRTMSADKAFEPATQILSRMSRLASPEAIWLGLIGLTVACLHIGTA